MRPSTTTTRIALGALALCGVLSVGCSSSTDAGDTPNQGAGYFIRFQAGGSQVEYRGQGGVFATFSQLGSQHNFGVAAVSDAGSIAGGSINIGVLDASPITTATYTGFQAVGTSGGFRTAQILYNIGGFEYSNSNASSDNTVTITEITPTTVRGTFRGTVRATGRTAISITNGQFYAKRVS